jgi:hypothetical protein
MEKKLYYIIDNGDSRYTMELDGCMEVIKGEMESYNEEKTLEDEPTYTITPIWMTEDEFENLPEAE